MEKTIGILTQTCPPNAPSMETPCNSDSPKLPAQGQTSQAIQIHHMASKQMLRNITLMEQTIGILTQTCPPNAPSIETPCNSDSPKLPQMPEPWKHHGNLTPSCPPGLSQMLDKLKTQWKSDSKPFAKAVTNVAQAENTMQF